MLCIYCTHKKSNLSQAVAEHNAWKQLRLCRTQRSENKSCFVLLFFSFFFFTSLWTFAPTTLKSILYLLGYKSFLWTQVGVFFVSVRVGFQMLEHFSLSFISLIFSHAHSLCSLECRKGNRRDLELECWKVYVSRSDHWSFCIRK